MSPDFITNQKPKTNQKTQNTCLHNNKETNCLNCEKPSKVSSFLKITSNAVTDTKQLFPLTFNVNFSHCFLFKGPNLNMDICCNDLKANCYTLGKCCHSTLPFNCINWNKSRNRNWWTLFILPTIILELWYISFEYLKSKPFCLMCIYKEELVKK